MEINSVLNNKDTKEKGKGFFIVNLYLINLIVKLGGGFEEVSAYVVLVRGAGRRREISTHGASSIAARTGMTYTRAEKSLKWLLDHKFISKAEDGGDEKSRKRLPRYRLLEVNDVEVKIVALANDLIDGVGRGKNNPPFARIYNDSDMGCHYVMSHARLDALMLLLCMYEHHFLAECGGIDPRSGLFKVYEPTENSNGNKIENFKETNLAMFEIQGAGTFCYGAFSKKALFYVPDDDQRTERFSCAFENLKRMGFCYETIQIWSTDPNKDENASPNYTLYILDRHARESEYYLSTSIHRAALRRNILIGYDEFFDIEDYPSANIINSGRFRFVAHKSAGGYPIGIFRLRFRAHTQDTGKGLAAEKHRVERWTSILEQL